MEKTYVIATVTFGMIITIALFIFTYYAFSLQYNLIGLIMLLIGIASSAMMVIMVKKWGKVNR